MLVLVLACLTPADDLALTAPELADNVSAAWARAGASVGWFARVIDDIEVRFTATLGGHEAHDAVAAFSFGACPSSAVLSTLPAPRGPFAVEIRDNATDATMRELSRFRRLTGLSLRRAAVTGDGLRLLAKSCALTSVHLEPNVADLRSIDALAVMTTLRHLAVLEADDLALAKLSKLRLASLALYGCKATNDGLRHPAVIPTLRYLLLSSDRITDDGFRRLSAFRSLERLHLSCGNLTDAGLRHLSAQKRLRVLDVSGTNVGGRGGLAALSSLPLTRLELSQTKVTDADLRAVGAMAGLERLDLSFTGVGDGVAHLAGLRRLRYLCLQETKTTDAAVLALEPLTGLRELSLARTRVSDAGLAGVAGKTELRSLSLFGTAVGDTGLRRLSPLRLLGRLLVMDTKVTDEGMKTVEGFADLRDLRVKGTKVTEESAARLRRTRPRCVVSR